MLMSFCFNVGDIMFFSCLAEVRSSSSNEVASCRSRDQIVTSPSDDVIKSRLENSFGSDHCLMDVTESTGDEIASLLPERECLD